MAAHHRHVAGVVMHAVFLFVGRVVLLIDNDEAEIRIRQEQRRARATTAATSPAAIARQVRARLRGDNSECHSAGRTPKARSEAVEELRGERDLRHQDQALPAAADHVGHGFEINFGLARGR